MPTTDPITDVLRRLRLRADIFLHARFCGSWAVDISGQGKAAFHVVARGDCWLHRPDAAPTTLQAGDLLILPRDAPHLISDQPRPPPPEVARNRPATEDDPGPLVSLICGYFEFGSRAWNPVIEALPAVMLLRPDRDAGAEPMADLIRLMITEAERGGAGGEVVLDRLGDALFVLAVRVAMARGEAHRGFLAALAHRHLRLALRAIHADPARSWTLETLAREAGLSRSAFATRFHALADLTPMGYLRRWRMQLAAEWLRDGALPLIEIAERLGYGSEAAFSRAFKRELGSSPGQIRRGGTVDSAGSDPGATA